MDMLIENLVAFMEFGGFFLCGKTYGNWMIKQLIPKPYIFNINFM